MIAGPASFLYAGLLGLLLVALSAQVVIARRKFRVGLGDGKAPGLEQAIRVQANFIEYAPLAVLLLVIAEIQGLPPAAIHASGLLLFVSRLLHAFGLSRSPGRSFGRFYGTAGTWLVITGLSLWLLWSATGAAQSPGSG